jgi:hypothetical protein
MENTLKIMLKLKLTADSPLCSCLYRLTGEYKGVATNPPERETWIAFLCKFSPTGIVVLYEINNDTARVLSVNEFSGQNFLVANSNRPVPTSTVLLFLYKHLTGLKAGNSMCCQLTCTCSSALQLRMKTKMDERKTIRIYLLIKYWNNLRTQQIIFW